jgi:hypothetical protein
MASARKLDRRRQQHTRWYRRENETGMRICPHCNTMLNRGERCRCRDEWMDAIWHHDDDLWHNYYVEWIGQCGEGEEVCE